MAAAAAARAGDGDRHWNPFYIERRDPDEEWDDDGDFELEDGGDGGEEREGLLPSFVANGGGGEEHPSADRGFRGRRRRPPGEAHAAAAAAARRSRRTRRRFAACGCLVATVLLPLLPLLAPLSAVGRGGGTSGANPPSPPSSSSSSSTEGESRPEGEQRPPPRPVPGKETAEEEEAEEEERGKGSAASPEPRSSDDDDGGEYDGSGGDAPTKEGAGSFDNDDDDDVDDDDDGGGGDFDSRLQLVALGERHSGVEWLQRALRECYPSTTVRTSPALTRPPYWFQGPPPDSFRGREIAVLAIFRDPYAWIREMRLHPIAAPSHRLNSTAPLPLLDFVGKPWTLDEPPDDEQRPPGPCQLGFRPDRVVPCRAEVAAAAAEGGGGAVYELDPTDGSVFDGIAELRAAKIRHLLDEIPSMWREYFVRDVEEDSEERDDSIIAVQYEKGLTPSLLQTIQRRSGLSALADCLRRAADNELLPPPMQSDNDDDGGGDESSSSIMMDPDFVKWMYEHADWDAEARIGYQPIQPKQQQQQQQQEPVFTLSSTAFANNSMVPSIHTGKNGISPPLSWSGAPVGTASFALIVTDPDDAPVNNNKPRVHWLLYNLPAQTTGLPAGVEEFPPSALLGLNDWNQTEYRGPAGGNGTVHHYVHKLHALDTMLPEDLGQGATAQTVVDAMQGHILAEATLVGLYSSAVEKEDGGND